MKDQFKAWATKHEEEGWDIVSSGNQGHFRLASATQNELYCRDAPTRGYCNVFVERATQHDLLQLAKLSNGWFRYEPQRKGVRVHVSPERARAMAKWCRRRNRRAA